MSEAADRLFLARQRHDPAEVLELHFLSGGAMLEPALENLVKEDALPKQLLGLPLAARQDQHLVHGVGERLDERENGNDGRFARLPAAVEEDAFYRRFEHKLLPRIRFEAEEFHAAERGEGGHGEMTGET
jgi:hypothetical protein